MELGINYSYTYIINLPTPLTINNNIMINLFEENDFQIFVNLFQNVQTLILALKAVFNYDCKKIK